MNDIRHLARLAFFFSGAAALIFETLWFRQAGLVFGNTLAASSVVLGAFMAGLGTGNGIAARIGHRVQNPFRIFALVEIAIGVSGSLIVILFPQAAAWVAPSLRTFFGESAMLHAVRMLLGFLILAVPAIAMGLTLPLAVQALTASRAQTSARASTSGRRTGQESGSSGNARYGETLGGLYGWNTLGAVAGAVGGHVLIFTGGTLAAAAGAALLNGGAALLAFHLSRQEPSGETGPQPKAPHRTVSRRETVPLLTAAFLSGGILLALEVIWFRFLHLFVHSTSLAFALMLAAVLAGIGIGGAAAGYWLRRNADADRHAACIALSCGALTLLLYNGFDGVLNRFAKPYLGDPLDVLGLTAALVLPTSLLSGVLFTFIGTSLNRVLSAPSRSTGMLALANTAGAGIGPACAGFLLLPSLGIEGSLFLLGSVYAVTAAALVWKPGTGSAAYKTAIGGAVFFVAAAAVFPFGKMESRYLPTVAERYGYPRTARIKEIREGRTETIIYLENHLRGVPTSYQLITDGFSMASSSVFNRRYMKLFVYWPVALHPDPERALLISYGVGSTAEALRDTRAIRKIDVVDISTDVLELSRIVHPDPETHPLSDPRVTVHIEDGRHFLQSTTGQYDLITSEPPPPKHAGVVNLYTKEYFQLIYDRLAEGGISTYWLPTHTLRPDEAKAIIRAYLEVFDDCSLWGGTGYNWIMIGSRNARWTRSESLFAQQWQNPETAGELGNLGFDRPEWIGSLFMFDAADLDRLTAATPPLEDRYPGRLGSLLVDEAEQSSVYGAWMETAGARNRFVQSRFIKEAWPEALRERTLPYFEDQRTLHAVIARLGGHGAPTRPDEYVSELHRILTETDLTTLPLWYLNLWDDVISAMDRLVEQGVDRDTFLPQFAARALAGRDYPAAADLYLRATDQIGLRPSLFYPAVYALAAAGRIADAEALARRAPPSLANREPAFWTWIEGTFGVRK